MEVDAGDLARQRAPVDAPHDERCHSAARDAAGRLGGAVPVGVPYGEAKLRRKALAKRPAQRRLADARGPA
jgi:hypothetical protein